MKSHAECSLYKHFVLIVVVTTEISRCVVAVRFLLKGFRYSILEYDLILMGNISQKKNYSKNFITIQTKIKPFLYPYQCCTIPLIRFNTSIPEAVNAVF